VLTLLAERATLFLPMALLLGPVPAGLAATLKPLVTPLTIVLLGIAIARTDWPSFAAVLRRPWLGLATLFAAMIAVPLIAAPLLRLMPIAEGLALALALMACLPPVDLDGGDGRLPRARSCAGVVRGSHRHGAGAAHHPAAGAGACSGST